MASRVIKNKQACQGFTLIELIVSLFVFGMVIIALTGIAIQSVKGQYKAFALQNSQEVARFVLESVTKELRICSVTSGWAPAGTQTISIINDRGQAVDYTFLNNRLYRSGEPLTPDDMEISGNFYVTGEDFPNHTLVTMATAIKTVGPRVEQQTDVYVQSSVSLRTF